MKKLISCTRSVTRLALCIGMVTAASYTYGEVFFPGGVESQCGPSIDWQDVELYDGTLGVSASFVDAKEGAVGQIQWNSNLASIYDDPGNVSGVRWCSGTLIGKRLFLTAGHCFDVKANDGVGADFPLDNATGVEITPQQAAQNMHVNFQYQKDGNGVLRSQVEYEVKSMREYRLGGLDYAVLELKGTPGDTFNPTNIWAKNPSVDDGLTIIQHPLGLPKVVDSGSLLGQLSNGLFTYDDIDTDNGSSGSGLLNGAGNVVGVHVQGGCESSGNKAVPITEIIDESPIVKLAALSTMTNFWQTGNAINVEAGLDASPIQSGWWSAQWSISANGSYYNIRNRWTGEYLHVEDGPLSTGSVSANWWSAQWKLIPVTGSGNNVYRIQNRWKQDQYIHIEHGSLESSHAEPTWWSGWWIIETVD